MGLGDKIKDGEGTANKGGEAKPEQKIGARPTVSSFTGNGHMYTVEVEPGSSVTLKWSTAGATGAKITNLGSVPATGSQTVVASLPMSAYVLTPLGEGGSQGTPGFINVIARPGGGKNQEKNDKDKKEKEKDEKPKGAWGKVQQELKNGTLFSTAKDASKKSPTDLVASAIADAVEQAVDKAKELFGIPYSVSVDLASKSKPFAYATLKFAVKGSVGGTFKFDSKVAKEKEAEEKARIESEIKKEWSKGTAGAWEWEITAGKFDVSLGHEVDKKGKSTKEERTVGLAITLCGFELKRKVPFFNTVLEPKISGDVKLNAFAVGYGDGKKKWEGKGLQFHGPSIDASVGVEVKVGSIKLPSLGGEIQGSASITGSISGEPNWEKIGEEVVKKIGKEKLQSLLESAEAASDVLISVAEIALPIAWVAVTAYSFYNLVSALQDYNQLTATYNAQVEEWTAGFRAGLTSGSGGGAGVRGSGATDGADTRKKGYEGWLAANEKAIRSRGMSDADAKAAFAKDLAAHAEATVGRGRAGAMPVIREKCLRDFLSKHDVSTLTQGAILQMYPDAKYTDEKGNPRIDESKLPPDIRQKLKDAGGGHFLGSKPDDPKPSPEDEKKKAEQNKANQDERTKFLADARAHVQRTGESAFRYNGGKHPLSVDGSDLSTIDEEYHRKERIYPIGSPLG